MMLDDVVDILGRSKAYAIYRLPFANEFTIVAQVDDATKFFYSISEIDGERGFLMIPFSVGLECPIVFIRPDVKCSFKIQEIGDELVESGNYLNKFVKTDLNRNKDSYEGVFSKFHSVLQAKQFDKLVLSRKETFRLCGYECDNKGALSLFISACALYPRMMVYLCKTESGDFWLGCTPEILLSGGKSHYRTVALAGTMKWNGEKAEWSNKNIEEQRIVADYVRQVITPLASVVEEEGPYTSRAGQLLHLKTEFHFSPKPNVCLCDIVSKLHPTPAVCGLPKREALDFIIRNEGYDREYYSGVVGMFDAIGETNLYVNLRCSKLSAIPNNQETLVTLYAGGGLLDSSVLESEWVETEEKLKTIGNVFN